VKALFCAVLLVVPPPSPAPLSFAEPFSPKQAFAEACRLSRYSCAGIKAPMVRYSRFVDAAGAYGIYMGGNTIWMSPNVSGARRYVVLVHETVHYLQSKVDEKGPPITSAFQRCVNEEEAFEVGDIVAARLNLPDMIRPAILVTSYDCPPPVTASEHST
jgi:hypothetical protein